MSAYVDAVYREARTDAYALAAGLYLTLLDHADRAPAADQPVLRRHVAQMIHLVPETLLQETIDRRRSTARCARAGKEGGPSPVG